MSLIPATPECGGFETRGLLLHLRRRGQRWHTLVCFGPKSHYYEDGGCEHTDALIDRLTPYGQKVTKLQPFGDGRYVPKRPRKRPVASPGEERDG